MHRLRALGLAVVAGSFPLLLRSAGSAVVGDLRVHTLKSAQFGNERQLRVLVPPGYDARVNRDRRYPVLLLNDGQNLFDPSTAALNPIEWGVDETVRDLLARGEIPPLIVVGIDSAGRRGRFKEYFPWVDPLLSPPEPNPQGARYPAFVVDEVLPFVRKTYRVSSDPNDVGIGGSSAGALAAVYAALKRPGEFGRLLVESPSLYLDDFHVMREAAGFTRWPARVYLGVGTNESNRDTCEGSAAVRNGTLAHDVTKFATQLRESGVSGDNLRVRIAPCGRHDEHAWRHRFPEAIRFLFGDRAANDRVIPTRYDGDRFFAIPVTSRGDTMPMFLDTGGGTLVFRPVLERFGLTVDSIRVPAGGERQVASLPGLMPGSELPEPIAKSPQGSRLLVYDVSPGLATAIARDAVGQLGRVWFEDQVWTLDYPARQVYWHGTAPPPSRFTAPPARRVAINFSVNSLGQKFADLPVTIDGDVLKFFLDTGAQIFLTESAHAAVNDGGPAVRGICILRASIFERLRARHPDWRAIERAESLSGEPILEVPRIEIGGLTIGPVWFKSYDLGPDGRPAGPDVPFKDQPTAGGLSGSALKYLSVTLDYPRSTAWIARER